MQCKVFTQRIEHLQNNAKLMPIYEILIRPKNLDTEAFYSSMGSSDSLEFAKHNIEWLQRNVMAMLSACCDAAFFSINVESKNLIPLKSALTKLDCALSRYGVRLIVEITERERMLCASVLEVMKYYHDIGIKLFVDDLLATEVGSIRLDLPFIAGFKIRLSDLNDFPSGFGFVGRLLSMGKVVVIENIEDQEQLELCMKNAVSFVQGYHVKMPSEVLEFKSLEMKHLTMCAEL